MEIKTKFNLNEEVFTMYLDAIVEATINGIKIVESNNMSSWTNELTYNLQMKKRSYIDRNENKLFKSKKELIENL